MEVARYLSRIASGPVSGTDLPALRHLQRAHLRAVPFENLDIRSGRALDLREAALFDKIVVRRRGGICYEQNTLFAALLGALGFRVTLLAAEVATANGGFGPPFDHMALLVVIGGRRHLVDVGFGDSFTEPLDLDQRGEQWQDTAAYEVRAEAPWHVVTRRLPDAGSRPAASFRFRTRARRVAHFEPRCDHHQRSAESHFTRKDICSLPTRAGRVTISGDQLIETRAGDRIVTELRDPTHRRFVLQSHFGIAL